MTDLKQKYVVRRITSHGEESTESKPLPQEEYFVLRRQDLLAVQALWGYVGVLHVACDVLPDSAEKAQLAILADQIADLAYEWDKTSPRKLPD